MDGDESLDGAVDRVMVMPLSHDIAKLYRTPSNKGIDPVAHRWRECRGTDGAT
jgi:hypothetical protein